MSFQFKQFKIEDHRCSQRVGTDGVLLGAWAPVTGAKILDIGTGSGLIAIMLAQRTNADITAIDIDAQSVEQARQNAAACPWPERIHIEQADILTWQSTTLFDAIVSNPPFFEHALECPDPRRSAARHTSSLPLPLLAKRAAKLLSDSGTLSVILPYDAVNDFIFHCQLVGLYLAQQIDIKTVERKPYRRSLLHFKKTAVESILHEQFVLMDKGDRRSDAYNTLTHDYYLQS